MIILLIILLLLVADCRPGLTVAVGATPERWAGPHSRGAAGVVVAWPPVTFDRLLRLLHTGRPLRKGLPAKILLFGVTLCLSCSCAGSGGRRSTAVAGELVYPDGGLHQIHPECGGGDLCGGMAAERFWLDGMIYHLHVPTPTR